MSGRREFFRALISPATQRGEAESLHPPYFKNEADFEKCRECEDKKCYLACEEKILKILEEKPVLDFSKSGCTYCDECALACDHGVLDVEFRSDIGIASIEILKCMAWNRTICSMCNDVCDQKAIRFSGFFNPQIDEALCNGCGFCIGVCPSAAIKVKRGEK